jgi:FtsH-binding integral membrane protein
MTTTVADARPVSSVPLSAAERARRERWFFSAATLAAAICVVWGFARTYFLKQAYGTPSLSPLLQVHGALFTTWMVLLLTQTALVATRNTRIHRRLGQAAVAVIPAMLVLGYMAAIDAAHRGSTIPGLTPAAFLIIPMAAIVVFTGLASAGMLLRRRPDYHKRLMLLATIELITAAIARIPAIAPLGPPGFFGVTDLFIVALIAFDLSTLKRVHPATWRGAAVLVASQPLRLVLSGTAAWAALATWLTR